MYLGSNFEKLNERGERQYFIEMRRRGPQKISGVGKEGKNVELPLPIQQYLDSIDDNTSLALQLTYVFCAYLV